MKYKIVEAHSGTDKSEIRKAQRLFRENVKLGKFPSSNNVQIVFSDIRLYNANINNIIKAEYMDIDTYYIFGEEIIKIYWSI